MIFMLRGAVKGTMLKRAHLGCCLVCSVGGARTLDDGAFAESLGTIPNPPAHRRKLPRPTPGSSPDECQRESESRAESTTVNHGWHPPSASRPGMMSFLDRVCGEWKIPSGFGEALLSLFLFRPPGSHFSSHRPPQKPSSKMGQDLGPYAVPARSFDIDPQAWPYTTGNGGLSGGICKGSEPQTRENWGFG
ncbi:hypothetical protein D8B26_003344 [Coccidioides posadasii str. Silveira]|uniref:Predicted protein n=1 Tax=Coccidioides posadasii (strain RMSCC 757 / Silveira) TaxID=443226 RepID=E9CZX5_COCPS|nr:predicted protein [Coccidioides posadasii str. Silveira]QVM08664.1 hypothetical protein D8B26_003344 [Coccidioides posadasii str. Silveira]